MRISIARGFTLTELAVVLAIIVFLIGGMLMPLGSQRELEQRRETQRSLESIREALIGYAIQNGRLPCPAVTNIATGDPGAGFEATTSGSCACSAAASGIAAATAVVCTSNIVNGVLPWATLGLAETDAWDRRYTYQVTTVFARSIPQTNLTQFGCSITPPNPNPNPPTAPAYSAFALCSPGKAILRTAATGIQLTNADEVPAVVLSHGINGRGAYLNNGSQIGGAAGDEAENADNDTDFVSNTNLDDLIIWLSRPILMNRMITAGKLP